MGRCPHHRVHDVYETCLDCGRSIYESDAEYLKHLLERRKEVQRENLSNTIEMLERELGINHPGNRTLPPDDPQVSSIGW